MNLNLNYSTGLDSKNINPWYITGFTDGEGSFSFSITQKGRKNDGKFRWQIQIEFLLPASNNTANKEQLELIKKFLGVGQIFIDKPKRNNKSLLRYRVQSLKDCFILKNHFEKYPLLTDKLVNFQIWCKVLDLMKTKEHLTENGLNKILALKYHSPKGLPIKLKNAFPNFINYIQERPIYNPNWKNININWLSGFQNADGCFKVQISNSKTNKITKKVQPLIAITQHINNLEVLQKIKQMLGLGFVSKRKDQPAADFKITSLKETNIFIEKFKETTIWGAKALDYSDFCLNITLMNEKKHLTLEGLKEIKTRNLTLNSRRTNFTV